MIVHQLTKHKPGKISGFHFAAVGYINKQWLVGEGENKAQACAELHTTSLCTFIYANTAW